MCNFMLHSLCSCSLATSSLCQMLSAPQTLHANCRINAQFAEQCDKLNLLDSSDLSRYIESLSKGQLNQADCRIASLIQGGALEGHTVARTLVLAMVDNVDKLNKGAELRMLLDGGFVLCFCFEIISKPVF